MTRPRNQSLPVVYDGPEQLRQTWLGFMRIYARQARALEQTLSEFDVSLAQFDVLATLNAGQGITQQELAERLLVTKGNVCGLIDRLEQAQLLERQPDPADRRANRLYLTRQGQALIRKAMPRHAQAIAEFLGKLDPTEQRALARLIEKLERV